MKTNQSGSGVKVVSEVLAIINDSKLSTARKLKMLWQIKIDGRPGADIARALINEQNDMFVQKYKSYICKSLVKMPWLNTENMACFSLGRGMNYPLFNRKRWGERFSAYLVKLEQSAFHGISYYNAELVGSALNLPKDKYGSYDSRQIDKYLSYNRDFRTSLRPHSYKLIIELRKLISLHNEKYKAEIKFKEETGLDMFPKKLMPVSDFVNTLSCPNGFIVLNKCGITASETGGEDWNAYSKAWHRAHGPKRCSSHA